jgi:hypothetical protein
MQASVADSTKSASAMVTLMPASGPLSLKKEYIRLGGRVIAIELTQ